MLELFATTFVVGLLYVFIPGPATLAALSLSAGPGRIACATFLTCHLLGDLAWSILAISAIIGVSQAGPLLFDILGLVCGAYLIWLGIKALRSQRATAGTIVDVPWRLEVAMTFQIAFPLVFAAFLGFCVATLGVVFWTGLPLTRRIFARHNRLITRAIGVVFIAAGAKSIGV